MADGAEEVAWAHTADLMAAVINSNPYRDGPPISPNQLNRYALTKEASRPRAQMKLADLVRIVTPG